MKVQSLKKYTDLIKEQDRTREAIALLNKSVEDPKLFEQLTSEFTNFEKLIAELENN